MKEIVDNFKNNMNVVKTTLALRHEQERKKLLMAYKQRPSGKYSSTAALTKGLYLDAQYDGPEVDCWGDKLFESSQHQQWLQYGDSCYLMENERMRCFLSSASHVT